MIEECNRCKLPVLPTASEWQKEQGIVCRCTELLYAVKTQDSGALQEPKRVPNLEQLYLDILAEHAPLLPKPLRNQEVIEGRNFKADFYWPQEKLIVEIDGAAHRTKERFYSDAEKHNLLVMAGFTYLRFTGRMLRYRVTDVLAWTREGLKGCASRKAT